MSGGYAGWRDARRGEGEDERNDDEVLNAYATLCQATFDLLQILEGHRALCKDEGCTFCTHIDQVWTALEEVNT